MAADPELHRLWLEAVAQSHQAYMKLAEKLQESFKDEPDRTLRRKLARQAARSVLPNATETKIFVTANARALRHFLEYRGAPDAEPEIRRVALAFHEIMRAEAPSLFGDYTLEPSPNGGMGINAEHNKA